MEREIGRREGGTEGRREGEREEGKEGGRKGEMERGAKGRKGEERKARRKDKILRLDYSISPLRQLSETVYRRCPSSLPCSVSGTHSLWSASPAQLSLQQRRQEWLAVHVAVHVCSSMAIGIHTHVHVYDTCIYSTCVCRWLWCLQDWLDCSFISDLSYMHSLSAKAYRNTDPNTGMSECDLHRFCEGVSLTSIPALLRLLKHLPHCSQLLHSLVSRTLTQLLQLLQL